MLFLGIEIHLFLCPPHFPIRPKGVTTHQSIFWLPTCLLPPSPLCFDTTLYMFLLWWMSCLIDLSICLWPVFSTGGWITTKQEPHLINLRVPSYYHWPCTGPCPISIWWMNPYLSWICTGTGTHNIARQPADVPHVKPRLIYLSSLLPYLPPFPLHPLIPLRRNT